MGDAFEAAQIFSGLAEGITGLVSTDEIAPCFTNAELFLTEVNQAYSKISTRVEEDIVHGFYILNGTMQKLDSYLGMCDAAITDEIARWAQITQNSKVDFSLSQQGGKVTYQLDKLVRHMNAPDNEWMAGKSLGELMVILSTNQ